MLSFFVIEKERSKPMELSVIILAAGEGQRMATSLPKVLHKVAGMTLLERVVTGVDGLQPEAIHVVYGHGGDEVRQELSHLDVNWVLQEQQLGTGHAVKQVLPHLKENQLVLILFGDVPLISTTTLQTLLRATPKNGVGLLVAEVDNPYGLGRIIRNQAGDILAIVEEKDATDEQRKIREIFTGIMAVPAFKLSGWLERLDNNNSQGEYYLTDVPSMAIEEGFLVTRVPAQCQEEIQGINTKAQLASLERYYQKNLAYELMLQGTTIMDPARFDVRGEVVLGKNVVIDINTIFEGRVEIGDNCQIGANCIIRDAQLGDNVIIKENSVIEDSVIGSQCIVGPFARLRPGTQLKEHAKVGNFVEIKKSEVGVGSKVNHLSYVGDTTIGCEVNVGAGTITCNYDGVNKFKTTIGDKAFIGSGTQLVAPVNVAEGVTIGAGSTITKDVAPGELALSRAKQTTISNWKRPSEEKQSCAE